jgi:hypothetical protein
VRKPPELAPSSSHRRLTFALLCAFAGCLNPRPEEYPSDTASPGADAAGAPAADNDSARQGADAFEPNIADEANDAPELEEPIEPPLPPQLIVPPPGVDAGAADAGVSDAGAPAISE